MNRVMIALAVATLSCSGPPPQGCARPWDGFHSSNDRGFWASRPLGIAPPTVHIVKIDRSGRIDVSGMKETDENAVLDYLDLAARLQPQPYIALDFDRGVECARIDRIRARIATDFDCETSERCLQGPAPYWVR